jgi:hypothetical protein
MVPAERESTADELPMPAHGLVTPDLILRPAQGMLHLLVTLLDPHRVRCWPVPSASCCVRLAATGPPGNGEIRLSEEFTRLHVHLQAAKTHSIVLTVVFIRKDIPSSQYTPFATFTYSKVESIHGSQSACGLCASAGREPGRQQVGDQMTSERVGRS